MKKWFVSIAFFMAISFPTVISAEGQTDCATLQNVFGTEVKSENGRCSVEMVREELQLTHMGESSLLKQWRLFFISPLNKLITGPL